MAAPASQPRRVAPRHLRRRGERVVPMRRCIASGEVRPKGDLIRFVVGPEGEVVPDVEERLPGRGLWLAPGRDKIDAACRRRLFAKAAKAAVTVPEDLADRVERLLTRRCIDLLGLANRAGLVVCGFEKTADRLAAGRTAVLVQACDAAEGGRSKLRAQARAAGADVAVAETLTAEELGEALGGRPRVHVAVGRGPLANRFQVESGRLAALRGRANSRTHG